MGLTLGLDQKLMICGAIVLAIAGPIIATIMLLRRSWERPGRVFWLYTSIFECTAMFSFGWGLMMLPRELWFQRVIEFASIGMLILALTLVSRLIKYVIPQSSSQSNASKDSQ